jgi:hypothetical protein
MIARERSHEATPKEASGTTGFLLTKVPLNRVRLCSASDRAGCQRREIVRVSSGHIFCKP